VQFRILDSVEALRPQGLGLSIGRGVASWIKIHFPLIPFAMPR
jgi:hypothetical protein